VTVKLTTAQRRALEILERADGPMMAGWFAHKMWPDSPSWRRHSKCGPKGSTTGAGIIRQGGSYLNKLCRRGFVLARPKDGVWMYSLTREGREALHG